MATPEQAPSGRAAGLGAAARPARHPVCERLAGAAGRGDHRCVEARKPSRGFVARRGSRCRAAGERRPGRRRGAWDRGGRRPAREARAGEGSGDDRRSQRAAAPSLSLPPSPSRACRLAAGRRSGSASSPAGTGRCCSSTTACRRPRPCRARGRAGRAWASAEARWQCATSLRARITGLRRGASPLSCPSTALSLCASAHLRQHWQRSRECVVSGLQARLITWLT